VAHRQLGDTTRRSADEEDVVLSALNSFFTRVPRGDYPELRDRNNLWPLLAKITIRKAINQRVRIRAQKRGGGRVRGDSVFATPDSDAGPAGMEQVPDTEPTPESLELFEEQCRHLLDLLPDDTFRLVVRRKLEGFSIAEIAKELQVVARTVDRKLKLIRDIWAKDAEVPS
jgi:DNA-directed RNA polymerase specialized sigma24 family protein